MSFVRFQEQMTEQPLSDRRSASLASNVETRKLKRELCLSRLAHQLPLASKPPSAAQGVSHILGSTIGLER
jgi:hypothetical protein